MKKHQFALIGHPLGHTMSPPIHDMLFKLNNIDAEYKAYDIEKKDVPEFYETLKKIDGFNITIPHKELIIPLLNELDEKAEMYGAVNTVKCGEYKGYNTDWIGFRLALKSYDIPLSGKVLVCGCGGVSRTMATEAILENCDITFAVREQSFEKAEKLKSDLLKINPEGKIKISKTEEVDESFDLLLNGTPLGMYPKFDAMPVTEEQIKKCRYVFDSIYNPRKTKLIQTAEKNGLVCSGGMTMLVSQAAAAQEIWMGVSFKTEDLIDVTEKSYEVMEEIFG